MSYLTKCESCGGGLTYSPQKKAICCEHCGAVYHIDVPTKPVKFVREYTADFVPEKIPSVVNQYICENCGTSHIVEAEKVSKRCPSCGSTNIRQTNAETYFADGIVPFELTKEKAAIIFDNWLSKRKFAPNDLHVLARNQKISKVYVPIFNVNATNVCSYNGVVKKVHVDSSTNAVFSTIHTVNDAEMLEIKNYPICANTVIDQDLIKNIIKFNQAKIVPFSSDYLFGYTAAQTNKTIHDGVKFLQHEYAFIAENKVRNKLKGKYDEIENLICSSKLENITFNYFYSPVFMNHYTYKNKNYHCYIDGTTGKVAGKAPKSVGKILAVVGACLAVIAGIAVALVKLLR